MNLKKAILSLLLFLLSFFIFTILDVGLNVEKINQIVQPLFFSFTFVMCNLFEGMRKYILACSLSLLVLLVVTYLLGMLAVADWIGSLGFGMLVIIIFSYLPQLIKKGYIEKF